MQPLSTFMAWFLDYSFLIHESHQSNQHQWLMTKMGQRKSLSEIQQDWATNFCLSLSTFMDWFVDYSYLSKRLSTIKSSLMIDDEFSSEKKSTWNLAAPDNLFLIVFKYIYGLVSWLFFSNPKTVYNLIMK